MEKHSAHSFAPGLVGTYQDSDGGGGRHRLPPPVSGNSSCRGSAGVSMAAADAPGALGFAERGCGEDDRDRDRYRLWILGIGPLCGGLPVTIRRSALGGTASPPEEIPAGAFARSRLFLSEKAPFWKARGFDMTSVMHPFDLALFNSLPYRSRDEASGGAVTGQYSPPRHVSPFTRLLLHSP
jgi:hypothetical protein